MSRRALVGLLVLITAFAVIVLFSRDDADTRFIEPSRAEPAPPAPRVGTPEVVVVTASSPAAPTGALTIALEREGKPEAGPRLVLRNADGVEASRTTDVMGLAVFELAPGPWLVMGPPELAGQSIDVTLEPRRVTLTMPAQRRVEGEVVDEHGAAVTGVPLTVGLPRANRRLTLAALGEKLDEVEDFQEDEPSEVVARTDGAGHFSFVTLEESLELIAVQGDARARQQLHPPASGVRLVLEPVAFLSVLTPSASQVLLSLTFGEGTVVHQLAGSKVIRVPVGELAVHALTVSRGTLARATHQVTVKSGRQNVLQLDFHPAPPISGVVQDERGVPLVGVTVGLKLAPSNPGTPPRAQETTVTDSRGHFELVPRLIRGGDPLYEVHLLPPWREKNPVRVRLGDAPLVVEATQ